MSVGGNSNGLRGKIKSTRDFYKKKESKSSCPILSCDGCNDQEDERVARDERTQVFKGIGSVAARAQAWEKCSAAGGYVTIGAVRYGVRLPRGVDNSVPSRGSVANDGDADGADYCCDVMQMAWPLRTRGSSLPPSKIPLPNTDKVQSINKRGKAKEERTAPVYRSTLEVSRSKKTAVGCFAVDSDESSNGDMKATPPTPNPARRPLFAKSNFKFGNSSSGEADTSRLISNSKEDLCGTGNQFQITLEKLQKFRFGGNNDKTNGGQKKKRISDKTERLRELTDKLLHSRGSTAGNADKKKSPSCNATSPLPRVSNKQTTGPSLRNLFGSTSTLTSSQTKCAPKREDSIQSVSLYPGSETRIFNVKSDKCTEANDEDKFDCDHVGFQKSSSKPLTEPCAQRLNAFRSASFSQVDYDTADGKYTRTVPKNESSVKPSSFGCVTFPRVKQVDASTSVSPTPDKVIEKAGSTPSVDSAVGSDEGFVIGSSNNLALMSDSHKPPGARSLTYPFTKKVSKLDEMPFSSIDGNGLKSLQHCPSFTRELSDVKEEVSLSSETQTIGDTLSEGSNDTVRELQTEKCCDNNFSNSASSSPNPSVSPKPDKTVYQCTVREFPVQLPSSLTAAGYTQNSSALPENNQSLESLEREINELITQQKNSSSSKPEIYVTTWPKETEDKDESSGKTEKTDCKLKLKCENNYKEVNWKSEDDGKTERCKDSEGEDGRKMNKRWSSDTSNDGSSEPLSTEENSFKNQWSKSSDKSKLTCQSSEEKDEDGTPNYRKYKLLSRNDSLSEGDSDQGERRPSTPLRERERTCSPSPYTPTCELSDGESRRSSHGPRRYSKRPLRGPYGQMLEAEMKKPETTRLLSKKQLTDDLKFLEEYISPLPETKTDHTETSRPSSESRLTCPRPRFSTGRSFDDSQLQNVYGTEPRSPTKRKASASLPFSGAMQQKDGVIVCHQRTTSSPSQLEAFSSSALSSESKENTQPSEQLLQALLKGSSERQFVAEDNPLENPQNSKDTRTHVVVELFDTEKSYVESLQTIVKKYLRPLKCPENSGLVDATVVDEIFYQIPAILVHHEILLDHLKRRLEHWDLRQRVGDIFVEVFTNPAVVQTYTAFINNWKNAKDAIRISCQQKPAFARFLETMTREHKGKLALDSLIIMPVQRIPRYELLIRRLLKHTDSSHPDYPLLLAAQHKVHELAVKINLTERESIQMEHQMQVLKELEVLIEGLVDLYCSDRSFIRHDTVTMASGQGTRKERALFLFSDLLIITSIKRRSGTIRKPSSSAAGGAASFLDSNKYKLLMRIPIDELEILKTKDENVRKMIREVDKLSEDVCTLTQISDLTMTLQCPRTPLEDIVREMLISVNKQLSECQSGDTQLSCLELVVNTQHGSQNFSVVFSKPEKKTTWEECFNDCKQKLALSADRRPVPEFVASVPIRKTRAGLQFTCAAPTIELSNSNMNDVWVCNSDGYVGQICVLSMHPEPTVTSCNGVCNARILCIASIPAVNSSKSKPAEEKLKSEGGLLMEDPTGESKKVELVSSSSSDEEDEEDEDESTSEFSPARSRSEPMTSESIFEDSDVLQPTMWLGMEDGTIHVYLGSDNIRIKKNKLKIQLNSAVQCIVYLDNRVFVSLFNGDVIVYMRDQGGWNTSSSLTVTVGTGSTPVTKMVPVGEKLWCACNSSIKVLNVQALEVEYSFQANPDGLKVVSGMAVSGFGVYVSLFNSSIIRLFNSVTYDCVCEINVASAVTKMLAGCDDIIRQHKAACLRVTALLTSKDLLWIGTSAGVILTLPMPNISETTSRLNTVPNIIGVPHGHTGHVRFLTCLEAMSPKKKEITGKKNPPRKHSIKPKNDLAAGPKVIVVSGGDGYEDFRNASISEGAGREDSTNHLLLWHI